MSDDLNKLDLLIKLMNMTNAAGQEASSDNLALVAIIKANAMLRAEGWDWDKLLRAKIKIITNPFATNGAMAPPAARTAPRAAAPPPPPTPAAGFATNPWPAGHRPQPRPQPAYSPPPPPPRPAVAPVGPIHFQKSSADKWCIAFHMALTTGDMVQISKRDGSSTTEQVGLYVERSKSGHYLYSINKASKFKQKYAGGAPSINDFSF